MVSLPSGNETSSSPAVRVNAGSGLVRRALPLCLVLLLCVATVVLAGCSTPPAPVAQSSATPQAADTLSVPATTATSPEPTASSTASATTTREPTPTPSPTSTPTASPTITPKPTSTPASSASLIAFETYRDGNGEIYLLDTTKGELTNLTQNQADDRDPAWHPDGGALAFQSHRDGNWEVYVLSLVDGSITRITEHIAYDGSPAWSPDGSQLAFESYRDGNLEIYAMDLASRQVRRLTEDPAGDYGPAWSPAGDWIAFTSWRDGDKDVYVVPAGGGEAWNLTSTEGDDEDPAWSPDGTALAFTSWCNVDPSTGNRNAEIYQLDARDPSAGAPGNAQRLTDNPWPDLDPAWDVEGRLVWASYVPGPAFETYDPYRPGDLHIYRHGAEGREKLTAATWDNRRPSPSPSIVSGLDWLAEQVFTLEEESQVNTQSLLDARSQVVEVPSVLASFSEQPIRVNDLVVPSVVAWQEDVLSATGWDLLRMTLGAWRNIDSVRKREMYKYDYGYLSWHKAGRAIDLPLEFKVDGSDMMLVVREDLGGNVYWRMYLKASQQDGTQGEPLKDNPWLYWWHIVPDAEPQAYDAGGKRLSIPSGYYVDVTSIAKRHGWERIACYAIAGDYHWNTDSNGTEYWHYERTDGLRWWEAMQQIYPLETLEEYAGWSTGLQFAQSEEMMRSKGIPTPAPY